MKNPAVVYEPVRLGGLRALSADDRTKKMRNKCLDTWFKKSKFVSMDKSNESSRFGRWTMSWIRC